MPEISWFSAPTDERPGTLNAAYQFLDARIIAMWSPFGDASN